MIFCTWNLDWRNNYVSSLYQMKFTVDFMALIRTFGRLPNESVQQNTIEYAEVQQKLNQLRHETT